MRKIICLVVSLMLLSLPLGTVKSADTAAAGVESMCPHHAAPETDTTKKQCCGDDCQCLGMNSCFGKTILPANFTMKKSLNPAQVSPGLSAPIHLTLFYITTPPPRS